MIDENSIKDIIKEFEYGQFNILDNGMKIKYNPENYAAVFDPFYHHDCLPTKGSCSELMNTAYFKIKEKHPDYRIFRANGNDPDFFREYLSNHCFLIVSENDIMQGQNYFDRIFTVHIFLNDPLLVDPSFKKIARFSESKYRVKQLYSEKCEFKYSNSLVLSHGGSVPLGINSEGECVFIAVDFCSPDIFQIAFRLPGSETKYYDMNSEELEQKVSGDPKISKFVELFRKREKTKTDEEIPKMNNTIIVNNCL